MIRKTFCAVGMLAVFVPLTAAAVNAQDTSSEWQRAINSEDTFRVHRERCADLESRGQRQAPWTFGGLTDLLVSSVGGSLEWLSPFDATDSVVRWTVGSVDNAVIPGGADERLAAAAQYYRLRCDEAEQLATGGVTPTERWFGETNAGTSSFGVPLSQYVLWVDDGGIIGIDRRLKAGVITWFWRIGVTSLRVAIWSIDWLATGRLTEILATVPGEVAVQLDRDIVGPLRLRWFAVTAVGMAAAWMLVRRRTAEAWTTVLFSISALMIGGLLLANFDHYLKRSTQVKNSLNHIVLNTDEIVDVDGVKSGFDASKLTAPIIDELVHKPWQELNWGRQLRSDCEIHTAWLGAVAGMGSHQNWPRVEMANCDPDGSKLAGFNHSASMSRVFGSLLVGIGQVFTAFLLLSISVLAMTSEFLLLAAFGFLPLAVAAAASPVGRVVTQKWVSVFIRGFLGFAVALLLLRVYLIVLGAIAQVGDTQMFEKFLLYSVLSFAAWRGRKLIPQTAAKISGMVGAKVSGKPDSSSGSIAGAAAGGAAAGSLLGLGGSQLLGSGALLSAAHGTRRATQIAGSKIRSVEGTAATIAGAAGSGGAVSTMLSRTKGGSAPSKGGLISNTIAAKADSIKNKKFAEQAQHMRAQTESSSPFSKS